MTATEKRAFRVWAVSMCIFAMHWGFNLSNLWMLTIHEGRLLFRHEAAHGVFGYLELPPVLTVSAGITSAIGWISIPVMLTALVFLREKFDYSDKQFNKHAKFAFLSALGAFILGFLISKAVALFTTVYTTKFATALTVMLEG